MEVQFVWNDLHLNVTMYLFGCLCLDFTGKLIFVSVGTFFSSTISYWRQQIKFDSSYWWKFEFSFNIGVVRLELIRPVNHPNVIVMVRETIDSSVVLNQIYKGLNKANPIKY